MKKCCQNPNNLHVAERKPNGAVVKQCKECGCKHYEMEAEAGQLGVLGASM